MSIEDMILKKIDAHERWLASWEKVQMISPMFKRGSGKSMNYFGYSNEVFKRRNKLAKEIKELCTPKDSRKEI